MIAGQGCRAKMYANIAANLDEVMQVKGCPLDEDKLWAILRKIITALHKSKGQSCTISPKHILFLPSGELQIQQKSSSCSSAKLPEALFCTNYSNSLQDVAMVLLWCAAYNLNEMCPLNISSCLQSLLTSMCEQRDICTIEHVEEICNHQHNAKPSNDTEIISALCATILGSIDDLELNEWNVVHSEKCSTTHDGDASSSILQGSFSYSETSLSSVSKLSYENEQIQSHPDSASHNSGGDMRSSTKKSTSKVSPSLARRRLNKDLPHPSACLDMPSSVLKIEQKIQTLHIDFQSSGDKMTTFYVEFMNHGKVEIITRNPQSTTALDILQSSLNVFLPSDNSIDLNQLIHFGLAVLKDSYFYFFDNATTLDKILQDFSFQSTYYVRLLYFPVDTSSLSPVLVAAMYVQVRADVIDERIICSPDEALELTALSMQCELGDYKLDYGNEYFEVDEFLPHRLISELGASYIKSELLSMHRQLAGIGERETRLLYLRKSQKLNDYGVNFFRVYRLKSCKEKHATWLGVGPRGISNFDVKEDSMRLKRHNLRWSDLKKIAFKNHKIALTKLTPEVKLKFYQKDAIRAKYVVTYIGKLHKYYSSHPCTNEMTALSLFDDITDLSSCLKKKSFSPSPRKPTTPTRTESKKSKTQWTYSTPQFKRNGKVVRKPSTSSNATDRSVPEKSNAVRLNTPKSNALRQKNQPLTSTASTKELVINELQEIMKEGNSSSFSSDVNPAHVADEGTSEMLPTPMARTKHKAKLAAAQKLATTSSDSSANAYIINDDIHATARSFYSSSLNDDYVIPSNVEQTNATLLKVLDGE